MPDVAVIIPCYNAERYVGEAIASAKAIRGGEALVVVVDDGSTDGSAEAIRAAAPDEVATQANMGVSAARNAGLALAGDAPFAIFLDADDRLHPEAF